jgi:hypothetical protein
MLCWIGGCERGLKANNHGLNPHLYKILEFKKFKWGMTTVETVETGKLVI